MCFFLHLLLYFTQCKVIAHRDNSLFSVLFQQQILYFHGKQDFFIVQAVIRCAPFHSIPLKNHYCNSNGEYGGCSLGKHNVCNSSISRQRGVTSISNKLEAQATDVVTTHIPTYFVQSVRDRVALTNEILNYCPWSGKSTLKGYCLKCRLCRKISAVSSGIIPSEEFFLFN